MSAVLPAAVVNVCPVIRLQVLSAGLLKASSDTGTNGRIGISDGMEGTGLINRAVGGGWSGKWSDGVGGNERRPCSGLISVDSTLIERLTTDGKGQLKCHLCYFDYVHVFFTKLSLTFILPYIVHKCNCMICVSPIAFSLCLLISEGW